MQVKGLLLKWNSYLKLKLFITDYQELLEKRKPTSALNKPTSVDMPQNQPTSQTNPRIFKVNSSSKHGSTFEFMFQTILGSNICSSFIKF